MRKILIIALLICFFSCTSNNQSNIANFSTINLQVGIEKIIDLAKYCTTIDDFSFENVSGVLVKYDETSKTLTLLADGSKPLVILPVTINKESVDLILRINPMVKHKFKYNVGKTDTNIVVMGQFNDWSRTALPLQDDDGDGIYERYVYLKPQRHEYKFVVNGKEKIDPNNPIFVSNNIGGWNSILDLSDYKTEKGGKIIKEKWNQKFLTFKYNPIDNNSAIKELFVMHNNSKIDNNLFKKDSNFIKIDYTKLGDGTLRIVGIDNKNRINAENITIIKDGNPLHPKHHPNDWHFAVLYNLMVDRFWDGDNSNTVKVNTSDLHYLANFHGGDLAGIIQKLEEGYFAKLGTNSIWLSPLNTQPDSAYIEWIPPNRKFTGYHGYWPIAARKIDSRYGTSAELKHLVNLAHSQNIKVILDFVSNHVHEKHPYFKDHREWFGSIELPNGEINIRNWSEETRLTTWFDEFIPSFNYPEAPQAIDQVVDDAIWWLKEFKFDGFRQDAVKHVPHIFWKKLTARIKSEFPDRKLYQIGETFGSDELILDYVNPGELDAQFNFAIYFNSREHFSANKTDFSELAGIIETNLVNYQPVNLMGNITSSHDQFRFIGLADGQVSLSDDGTERTFENPPKSVQNVSSYSKLANFHAFNISMPGIPVVYYGEEIGLMGSGDPGNRRPMRFGENVTANEAELLKQISQLNKLRREFPALALGDLEILKADGPMLTISKTYFNEKILVMINNGAIAQEIDLKFMKTNEFDLLTSGMAKFDQNKQVINLASYSHKIIKF